MSCFGCPQTSANSRKLGKLQRFYTSVYNYQLPCSLWINSCTNILSFLCCVVITIIICVPIKFSSLGVILLSILWIRMLLLDSQRDLNHIYRSRQMGVIRLFPWMNKVHQFHDLHCMNFRLISYQMNPVLGLDVSLGRTESFLNGAFLKYKSIIYVSACLQIDTSIYLSIERERIWTLNMKKKPCCSHRQEQ